METFFKDIQQKIIKVLDDATIVITIVVPWFTDFILFQKIISALQRGIKVQIILEKDNINKSSKIDYNLLTALNGELYWHKSHSGSGILHDKFCITDNKILITGSYNWTYSAANLNKENVMIIHDNTVILEYNNKFIELSQGKDCKKHIIPENEVIKYEKVMNSDKFISLIGDSYIEQGDQKIIPYKFWEKGWKYRDVHGNDIFENVFDEAYPFYFDVAKVKIGTKWGLIDKTGTLITDTLYDEIGNLFLVGFYSILDIPKYQYIVWAKIKKEGKEAVPCLFDNINYEFIPEPCNEFGIVSDNYLIEWIESIIDSLKRKRLNHQINWIEKSLKR